MMQNSLNTHFVHILMTGGVSQELETAARVICSGDSGEMAMGAPQRIKLLSIVERRLAEAQTSEEQCRLLCLMYEVMTSCGDAWTAKADSAFVNAFLAGSERWMHEACADDGVMRALLCRASAYYLYCQEADFNPNVRGFICTSIDGWTSALKEDCWHGTPLDVAIARISAMQAWAMADADFGLMDKATAVINAYAEDVLRSGTVGDVVHLHDLAEAAGVLRDLVSRIDVRLNEMLDGGLGETDRFAAESALLESECHRIGSLSAV